MEISRSQLRSTGSEPLRVKLKNSYFVQRLCGQFQQSARFGKQWLVGKRSPQLLNAVTTDDDSISEQGCTEPSPTPADHHSLKHLQVKREANSLFQAVVLELLASQPCE